MFQNWQSNANTVNKCCNHELPLNSVLIKQIKKTLQQAIKTLDKLAKWSAMPKWELQNHIAWWFDRSADFSDYIDHIQYSSYLNNAKFIWFNTVAIVVMTFECNEQAVQTVCCTGSTMWRKYNRRPNGTVFLMMGMSLTTHCQSTAGHITARLDFVPVI